MDLGETRGFLIARVHWTPDSTRLAIERMNRVQNHLDLLLADASAGTSRSILAEADPYWINHNDLFRFVGKDEFLWGSERDGFLSSVSLLARRPAAEAPYRRRLGSDRGRWSGRISAKGLLSSPPKQVPWIDSFTRSS